LRAGAHAPDDGGVISPLRVVALGCAGAALVPAAACAAAPPTVLWPAIAGKGAVPVVAASSAGGAVAGWTVGTTTADWRAFAAASSPAGGWEEGSAIPAPLPALLAGLGIDAGGRATAVLTVVKGPVAVGLSVTTREPGGPWVPPVAIAAPANAPLRSPNLVVNGRGDALLVWERYGADSIVRASIRPAGGAWGRAVDLEGAPAPAHESGPEPRAAIDDRGRLVVVWQRAGRVVAARGSVGGGWARPVALTPRRVSAFGPQVGFIEPGRPLVVWGTTVPSTAQGVGAAVGAAGGGWHPERLPVVPRGRGGGSPVLATAGSGRAAVVWGRDVAQRRTTLVTTRAPDGIWRAPIALVAGVPLLLALAPPNVAVRGDGRAVVGYRLAGRSVVAGIDPDGTVIFRRTVGKGGAGVPVVAGAGRRLVAVWVRNGVVRALEFPPS
jgi:hypothetical protein